jgi:hypothetical protein
MGEAPRTMFRGHRIYLDEGQFRYDDTGELTEVAWVVRPCGACGRSDTAEGHDGCLGSLVGVANACCGHGRPGDAYVQLISGVRVGGSDAVDLMRSLGGAPWDADGPGLG